MAGDVRLGDVAQVTLGPEHGGIRPAIKRRNRHRLWASSGGNGNTLEIQRRARGGGRSATAVPDDVRMFITSDSADFINGAIHEVE